MAPIVAPSIARFAIEGTIEGRAYANVLHYRLFQLIGLDRSEACFDKAGDIMNNWDDHIRPYQSNQITLERVTWLDLDSLDGSKGERSSTADTTWPVAGNQGTTMAANVSWRAIKQSTAGRGQRTGRMYLGPPQETWTTADNINVLTPEFVTNLNDGLESFRSGTEGREEVESEFAEYDSGMVVIHTRAGEYVGYSDVTGLTVDPLLATQRRRLR